MTSAKHLVPEGTPLHSRGSVALVPSQVYRFGSAPPSATFGLLSTNFAFASGEGVFVNAKLPGSSSGKDESAGDCRPF